MFNWAEDESIGLGKGRTMTFTENREVESLYLRMNRSLVILKNSESYKYKKMPLLATHADN